MPSQLARNERQRKPRARSRRLPAMRAAQMLAHELVGGQLLGCDFLRRHAIDRWVVDFYCRALKLAIVVDRVARGDLRALRRIERRVQRLANRGVVVLRFTDEEIVHNPDGVIVAIRHSIRNRPQWWRGYAAREPRFRSGMTHAGQFRTGPKSTRGYPPTAA